MPRRGEYQRDFPVPTPTHAAAARVGRREVTAIDSRGQHRVLDFDPRVFRCPRLAGELADEWVELAETSQLGCTSVLYYRQAIEAFCRFVDQTVPQHHLGTCCGGLGRKR